MLGIPIAQARAFFHLGLGLRHRLAHLLRRQRSQRIDVRPQDLGQAAQHVGAFVDRHGAPRLVPCHRQVQ
jgi:hypothetical protein